MNTNLDYPKFAKYFSETQEKSSLIEMKLSIIILAFTAILMSKKLDFFNSSLDETDKLIEENTSNIEIEYFEDILMQIIKQDIYDMETILQNFKNYTAIVFEFWGNSQFNLEELYFLDHNEIPRITFTSSAYFMICYPMFLEGYNSIYAEKAEILLANSFKALNQFKLN
jgi:hypothetical protein